MSIAKHIFLTGATGVLGRELVPRLLRDHPGARLTTLLRPGPDGSIADRLSAIRATVPAGARLDAVAGDVGAPDLGLSEATRSDLCRSVTHVVHGAATTRLDAPPELAQNVNVDGTLRALALAESCRRLELFAHVSTAYVCGDREGLVHEWELFRGQRFLNSYEESKCRAEFEVRRRSLEIPIAVFRPSIIVGDSRTGRVSSFASLYSPLRHIAEGTLRRMPCAAEARLDLIPVDRVAESIARLTTRPCAVGEVYHLCAGPGRRVSMERLMGETIRIAGSAAGMPLRFDDDSRLTAAQAPPPLRVFFDYLLFDREFSVTRAEAHLGDDVGVPPDRYLEPMLEYCRRTDWGRLDTRREAVA